ncbi:hypothetical protein BVG19_g3983 [[Candida] boidinii]|nr:hypothetical protein BVG19_g3983 [[Candida] boidinii]OWB52846.1 hypothetical protein B5S27_g4429 [[Candida] boidinii]
MTDGYYNAENEEDPPPPQYNEFSDLSEIGNESSNRSTNHVDEIIMIECEDFKFPFDKSFLHMNLVATLGNYQLITG